MMMLISTVRARISRITSAWTAFWFAPQDPLSLGVMRWLVGGMMLYSHFVWGLDLEGFFGPHGWQSVEAIEAYFGEDWLPSLWWYVPVEHLRVVHVLCLLPPLLFMLGVATPVTSVLAMVVTISNSNRAPLANFGMDQILSVLGLYLVIGGSGDRLSVDACWRRRRARLKNQKDHRSPSPTSRARLATRLVQVHFCLIYFFAGISKLQGDAWWNGEAIWMAFANREYQSIDMTWLAHAPWITQLATHLTVLWEISFPFLIWNRTLRPVMLLLGLGMHAGIGLCMGMITFGLIMIFGYCAFVPPEVMQRVLDAGGSRIGNRRGRLGNAPDSAPNRQPTAPENAPIDDTQVAVMSASDRSRPSGNATPAVMATNGHATSAPPTDGGLTRIGICDPTWSHRPFAHYLSHRNYGVYVSASLRRLWCQVEEHDLGGVVLFVDRLRSAEFGLLLDDLTLSPLNGLPTVIVTRRPIRLQLARELENANHVALPLPATNREIRLLLESVLTHQMQPTDREQPLPQRSDQQRRHDKPLPFSRPHSPDRPLTTRGKSSS